MPADRFVHFRAGKSHRVSMLTDLEFRVWIQYLLSADDFGVMRATPLAFQNDNDHLANRKVKEIQRCIDTVRTRGLVGQFEHQGKPYLFQPDWQTFQKVEYPRTTHEPKPTPEALALCDDATRILFSLHPGGSGRKFRKASENIPRTSSEGSPNAEEKSATNARAHAREVANGEWLTANGSDGGAGETAPPIDRWLRELQNGLYPSHRVTRNQPTESAFCDAMAGFSAGPHAAWVLLKANLAANRDSYEWRVKGMVPKLEKYLREGTWRNAPLPAAPAAADQMSKSTSTTLNAMSSILGKRA